jgi:glycosyltransferase involved in cell wall biosynthesis
MTGSPDTATSRYRILHTEWSNGWGGQEQRIILECRKMLALGHQVVIACQPGSGILQKARENQIPVAEVVIRGSIDPLAIWGLYRIIKKHRINVVNTHSGKDSWPGGFAAKLAGVDLLVRTRHLSNPIANKPFNFIHRMADGIITTGETIRTTMIRDNGIDPEKIISIATGVTLTRFDPDNVSGTSLRKEFALPDQGPVVAMVAVLRSMKRHDLLIEAAKVLSREFAGLRFLIVGEGPGREWLEGLIREAGLEEHVILTGYRGDVPRILALADVVVLTSDRNEGVPQSLSQAMAMGRPVVASPIGSITELVIDGRTGLLAEAGNAQAFAGAIRRLLSDDGLRRELGAAAKAHILAAYTDDIMAAKTIAFYDYLLARKQAR